MPPPHQLGSLLSPEPAPPITHHHQPAQAAAVTTAVGTSSGLHRWQHSAVWKLPRKGLDKNIAIRLSPLTVVCSVPGTQTGYQADICSSQSWHLARQGSARQSRHQEPGSAPIVFSSHDMARPRPGGWHWCWNWEERVPGSLRVHKHREGH